MSQKDSYRQILRSSSIIGGASVINIVIGLLRTKVAAVLLGPAGVGLIGLMQSLMATVTSVAAMGFGTVGTRQIAEAESKGDGLAISAARRALFWGTMGLALLGALGFWMLRDILAVQVLGDYQYSGDLGWLAVGVALGVSAGSQTALLNGLRRIGDLARLNIASALLSTVLGVAALCLWGEKGVMLFVLAAPVSSFVLGHWFVAKIGRVQGPLTPLAELARQWKKMGRLGCAFMISGLVAMLGQLLVRTMVQRELGAEALGHFQAAWAISMTYIGFVLTAMGSDYYPRLTAAIHDQAAVNRMVNEQTEVALLLSAPIFLLMLGFAPWIIEILYSGAFEDAIALLRWQVLGDILKVASWPLGFIILAAGDGRTFMFSESLAVGVFAVFTWIGLPQIGIQATGVGFLMMYAVYMLFVYLQARRRTGFRWQSPVIKNFVSLGALASIVMILSYRFRTASALLALAGGLGFGIYALVQLSEKATLGGPVGKIAGLARHLMSKLGVRRE